MKLRKRFSMIAVAALFFVAWNTSALAQATPTPSRNQLPAITPANPPVAQPQTSRPPAVSLPAITPATGPAIVPANPPVAARTKSSGPVKPTKPAPSRAKTVVPAMTRAQADEIIRLQKESLAEVKKTNTTLDEKIGPAVNGLDAYTREHFPAFTNSISAIAQQTTISYNYIWWVANGLLFLAVVLVLVLMAALLSWVWHAVAARFNQPVVIDHHHQLNP